MIYTDFFGSQGWRFENGKRRNAALDDGERPFSGRAGRRTGFDRAGRKKDTENIQNTTL